MSTGAVKVRSLYTHDNKEENHKVFDIFYSPQSTIYRMFLGHDARNKLVYVSVTNANNRTKLIEGSATSLSKDYKFVGNLTTILTSEDEYDIPF